jgi:hypothetical protein
MSRLMVTLTCVTKLSRAQIIHWLIAIRDRFEWKSYGMHYLFCSTQVKFQ